MGIRVVGRFPGGVVRLGEPGRGEQTDDEDEHEDDRTAGDAHSRLLWR
jgi:hypothetical protein